MYYNILMYSACFDILSYCNGILTTITTFYHLHFKRNTFLLHVYIVYVNVSILFLITTGVGIL